MIIIDLQIEVQRFHFLYFLIYFESLFEMWEKQWAFGSVNTDVCFDLIVVLNDQILVSLQQVQYFVELETKK